MFVQGTLFAIQTMCAKQTMFSKQTMFAQQKIEYELSLQERETDLILNWSKEVINSQIDK